ncbi:MAG: hypothetical protein LC802_12920 [Acidobacteria bacterium]|nr:hypothetical protein [Acidobacteriota bacterium]
MPRPLNFFLGSDFKMPTHAQLVPPDMIPFQNIFSSNTSKAEAFFFGTEDLQQSLRFRKRTGGLNFQEEDG